MGFMNIIRSIFLSILVLFPVANYAGDFSIMYREYQEYTIPKESNAWVLKEEISNDRQTTRIWSRSKPTRGEEESIIEHTVVFLKHETPSLEEELRDIFPQMDQVKPVCLAKNGQTALLEYKLQGKFILITYITVTPYGCHSLTYSYEGKNTHKVDVAKWVAFLKSRKIIEVS